MHRSRIRRVSPTGSYIFSVPADCNEDADERVSSFWRDDSNVLLQVSSFLRVEGQQVSAATRLQERLDREGLQAQSCSVKPAFDCPDIAYSAGLDSEGVLWITVFGAWPDLTIVSTVSGLPEEIEEKGD